MSRDAPHDVIRAAYRAMAARYHPDRNPGDAEAEAALKRINQAFHEIGDPTRRRLYDAKLRSGDDGTGPPGFPPQEAPQWTRTGSSTAREAAFWRDALGSVRSTSAPPGGGWRLRTVLPAVAVLVALVGAGVVLFFREQAPPLAPATDAPPSSSAQQVWVNERDFRVAFPAAPQPPEQSTVQTRWGPTQVTRIALHLPPADATLGVARMDSPTASVLTEQGTLDEVLATAGAEVRVVADERVTMGHCTGRSIEAVVNKTRSARLLLCVRGSHSYVASAWLPAGAAPDVVAEARSFLGTFEIAAPGSP